MSRVESWLVDVMDGIRVCLGEQLEQSRAGAPCFLALYPGQQIAADHCGCGADGCGMAWVRLARAFTATKFPTPDAAPVVLNLKAPTAVALEVGTMRCIPTGTVKVPPSAAQQINATFDQLSDMEAMRHALTCCAELEVRDVALGQYAPLGLGACAGGAWSLTVSLRPTGGE